MGLNMSLGVGFSLGLMCASGFGEEELRSGAAQPSRGAAQPSGGAAQLREGEKFAPAKDAKLQLEELFKGPELNRSLWNTSLKVFGRWGDRYHNSSYLNYLSDEDVLLEKGHLRLRAERRSVEGDASASPDDLVRISVGLEDARELIADLAQALATS